MSMNTAAFQTYEYHGYGGLNLVAIKIVKAGKKYMWDGREYLDGNAAKEQIVKYMTDKFDAVLNEEGGKFYLYTRRVITDIVLEGGQPS
jgi:hypothetical protein